MVLPIQTILEVLGIVVEELKEVVRRPSISESRALYDGALNLLFNTMTLAQPLAFRREANGRLAFLWIEDGGSPHASFHWLVCYPDGTWKRGTEPSQEECQRVANAILSAPGGEHG